MQYKNNIRSKNFSRTRLGVMFHVCLLGSMMIPSVGWADQIALSGFSFFSGDPVTIAADGSSATLGQAVDVDPIQLINDPFFGDPNVIVPGPQVVLSFDYDFFEAAGEDDEFGAFVTDPDTGDSIGSAYEFFTQDTGTGTIAFDLSSLDGIADLGLLFQLAEGVSDTGIDSTVTISNLRIVPEPSSAIMWLCGVIVLGYVRTRYARSCRLHA